MTKEKIGSLVERLLPDVIPLIVQTISAILKGDGDKAARKAEEAARRQRVALEHDAKVKAGRVR